jgi:hypothetical protein
MSIRAEANEKRHTLLEELHPSTIPVKLSTCYTNVEVKDYFDAIRK